MKKIAVLLCGGVGTRMGNSLPKQFLQLDNGLSILATAVLKFAENSNVDELIIVANSEYHIQTVEVIEKLKLAKPFKIVNGGATRVDSSCAGVLAIENAEKNDLVLIHDVARPFVSADVINRACEAMNYYQAASAVIPSSDTIYILNQNNEIEVVPARKNLCNVQTPQVFHYEVIKMAHLLAKKVNNLNFTDDSSMVHYFNLAKVGTFAGDIANKKITDKSDL